MGTLFAGLLFLSLVGVLYSIISKATKRKSDLAHLRKIYSPSILQLATYAKQSDSGMQQELRKMRVAKSESMRYSTPKNLIFLDIICIIRRVALENSEITFDDAQLLRAYCFESDMSDFKDQSTIQFWNILEETETSDLHGLALLTQSKHPDTTRLKDLYLALAAVAGSHFEDDQINRKAAVEKVQESIRREANAEPPNQMYRTFDEVVDMAARLSLETLITVLKRSQTIASNILNDNDVPHHVRADAATFLAAYDDAKFVSESKVISSENLLAVSARCRSAGETLVASLDSWTSQVDG
jgi:hypothetical protein